MQSFIAWEKVPIKIEAFWNSNPPFKFRLCHVKDLYPTLVKNGKIINSGPLLTNFVEKDIFGGQARAVTKSSESTSNLLCKTKLVQIGDTLVRSPNVQIGNTIVKIDSIVWSFSLRDLERNKHRCYTEYKAL